MELISENTQSTVVARFEHKPHTRTAYQSEAQLEDAFIQQLQAQGYEYLDIHTEAALKQNLRLQLERLNKIQFTDNEWEGFFRSKLANQGDRIEDRSRLLHDERTSQLLLIRDNGEFQNITIIDKRHIHENSLQVIHQYTPEGGRRQTRYDVTILVNGLPMVHCELKRRGVAIKEAFNQINRYKRDSFWADSGLFEYIQLFVITNGTDTKYYSNTTRNEHLRVKNRVVYGEKQTSNSFEFTSYWADRENNIITDLEDFTATFFQKHTLLSILTRYCVFTVDELLLVMRPYQISATEAILQQIKIATNHHLLGTIDAGGYIWHTTGSGKTLTSFKTAQLASQLNYVNKVLFVVDRKDLDYQTIREYERFKKGCVSSNKSTAILTRQLGNDADKIIITTIQKLNSFCKKEKQHSVYGRHVVIIFDECHRSQFGDMHKLIVKRFQRYHIFGFTGTPIFPQNAGNQYTTTEQTFGKKLHTYTVINAIADQNVLPFRVEYIQTVAMKDGTSEERVRDIDRERALLAPERIHNVVQYTLEHFDQKTKRNSSYKLKDKRIQGFNSIFATASIPVAMKYYQEFKQQMEALPPDQRLKIALIYSYGVNEDEPITGGMLHEEDSDSAEALDKASRDFLDEAIKDYNRMFSVNYSTSADHFGNYYKDVSQRMKNRELDMLIVVNMFLTGFDATTLNTLWVDKNLKQHGLMQAYSRTNRVLNAIKSFGNIVCFRNLEKETNDAITLFGDSEACGLVLLKTFDEYMNGYDDENGKHHPGYMEIVAELKSRFPLTSTGTETPIDFTMMGETNEKEFIQLFGTFLRAQNILSTFDRFDEEKKLVLSEYSEQDYRSRYLDLKEKYRPKTDDEATYINDDLVFEIELLKQVEINIDYILNLISEARKKGGSDDKEIHLKISKAIEGSPDLRNKKDLIEEFVRRYATGDDVPGDWLKYVKQQAKTQLDEIISEEKLKEKATYEFLHKAFQTGAIEDNGTAITECLPPVPLFAKDNPRATIKARVLERLHTYFERFYDIFDFIF